MAPIAVAALIVLFALLATANADAKPRAKRATVPTAPAGFFGVHPRSADATDYARIRAAGAGVVRTGWVYSQLKPSISAPLNWSVFDADVANAARNKLDLLPVLLGSPSWLGSPIPLAGESASSWRLYLVALAFRYGPGGSFWAAHPELPYRPLRTWQIWNEPNALSNWNNKPDPVAYGQLLSASADAVHLVDPTAKIVSAGVISLPPNPAAPAGIPYMQKMLKSKTTRTAVGALAVHPYAGSVAQIKGQLVKTRRMLDSLGMKKVPIWITEISWGSGKPGRNPLIVSPAQQQANLKAAFTMILQERVRLNIAHAIWYQWRDGYNGSCVWCPTSGLITESGAAKPLLGAFTAVAKPAAKSRKPARKPGSRRR